MNEHLNPILETTVLTGTGAEARLRALGVGVERLHAALDAGENAAGQADQFSPVTGAGVMRWVMTTTMLRRGLAADGWVPSDPRNSPRITHPDSQTSIVSVSGNSQTGLEDGNDPRSARPRGAATTRSVEVNEQLQFNLAALLPDMAAEWYASTRTWFLLYYRAKGDELRAELSLPIHINNKGHVDGWRERILLPSVAFGPDVALPRDAGEGGTDVEFTVQAIS